MKNYIVSLCIEKDIFSDWAWLQVFKALNKELSYNPGVWTCIFVLWKYGRFVRDAYKRKINYWCWKYYDTDVNKDNIPFDKLATNECGYFSMFIANQYREEFVMHYLHHYKSKAGKFA